MLLTVILVCVFGLSAIGEFFSTEKVGSHTQVHRSFQIFPHIWPDFVSIACFKFDFQLN